MRKEDYLVIFLAILMVFIAAACGSSSGEQEGDTTAAEAFKYYQKMSRMIPDIKDEQDKFNRALATGNLGRIKKSLASLQAKISKNADRVDKMGGFKGNSAYNYAVLDILEFYESLYSVEMAGIVFYMEQEDFESVQTANKKFKDRLENELPPLETKFDKEHVAFVEKYKLGPSKPVTIEQINKQLDYLEKHGSPRTREKARRMREDLEAFQGQKKKKK